MYNLLSGGFECRGKNVLAMQAGVDSHVHHHGYVHSKGDGCLVVRSPEMRQSVVFRRDINHCVTCPVGAEFLPLSYHAYLARGAAKMDFELCIGAHLIGVFTEEDACHSGILEIHRHQTRAVDFLAPVDWEVDPAMAPP